MRPVRIDFVEPRAWKFIWAAAALVVLAIVTTTGVKVWQLRQQRVVLEQQLAAMNAQQMQRLAQAPESPQDNPRAVSEAATRRLLQRDWNRLYDAIETPALAKVRLVQLNMDAVSGQVVLEYELESMAQVSAVTQALNDASGKAGVWRLERVDKSSQGGGVVETDRFRAILQCVIE